MKQFGKFTHFEQNADTVRVFFENGQKEVQILTEWILRFFAQITEEKTASRAIEGEKGTHPEFTAQQERGCLVIRTGQLEIVLADDARTDIYDRQGNALCQDYCAGREHLRELDAQTAELMAQEGHKAGEDSRDHAVQIMKKLDGDECFYGLGDKTGFLNKRGYEYICWNTDNPDPQVDCFKSLYKSIPFFLTRKKDAVYGLFFDNTFRTFFDFGKESDRYFWFGADRGNLDYYFIGGAQMKDVVRGYTYLTGRAPLPQLWTLGYHQSRWGYKCEADIRRIAEHMREYDLPCTAIHMDIDYMERYKVFTVDSERFPDLPGLTADLQEMGIRLVTIMDPGVKVEQGYRIYEEGIENGYFAADPDGNVYENVVWPGDSVYPDFGRSEVRAWWGEQYRALTEAGVSGIWTDMNEPASFRGELPEDVVFYDEERKSCHAEQHNLYGHNMARATYQGLKELTGEWPFVITRACYSGTQKYAIGWTGDNHSIWAHLQMAIPQLCGLGLSGMPLVGTDIGGFSSDVTKELLCRWVEVGCFSPFCRNHASVGTREQEPWQFDTETLEINRKYLKLRQSLLPYLYDLCRREEADGIPMMRPLVLEYEKDENTWNLNGEFMLGENLLIAPVVDQGMRQKLVYLPEGVWYDFWTGEAQEGGRYFVREAELGTCPVYVKAGTILPMYPPSMTFLDEKDGALELHVYPGEGESVWVHYQDNGEDFDYQQGAYNEYEFRAKEGQISAVMLHEGYTGRYRSIRVCCADGEMEELEL